MWPALAVLFGILAFAFAFAWLGQRRQARQQLQKVAEALRSLTGAAANPHGPPLLDQLITTCAAEQRRLQRAARETEENFRAILASMAEGVVVVDQRRQIQLANPSLLKMFALRQDPVGQTVLQALRQPLLESMMRTAIEEGEPQQEETSVQLAPGQSSAHLIISTLPLLRAGESPGAVTVIRDISRLRELEEMRREFVANVSHELRTPLAIFHGYLENLLDRPNMPEAELVPIFKVMQKHSGRLNALVEDLLTLTRLESRRDPLAREATGLPAFFEALADDWDARCSAKAVSLRVEVAPEVPRLSLDPHRFRQVLDNLLENAVKYSPKGGEICLRAQRSGDAVEVSVEDEGAGIPPADLPHIFERFYRADKARSRELGGTGLGLSIVKHIVQAHGGAVRAESTYGKGTTILITLPLDEKVEPPPEAASPSAT